MVAAPDTIVAASEFRRYVAKTVGASEPWAGGPPATAEADSVRTGEAARTVASESGVSEV